MTIFDGLELARCDRLILLIWRVVVDKAMTEDGGFERANAIAGIVGCDIVLARN